MPVDWQTVAQFWVPGIPFAQPRPRGQLVGRGRNAFIKIYTPDPPKEKRGWKKAVAAYARCEAPSAPLTGPLRVDIEFHLPRPQRLMRKRDPECAILAPVKPDRDNLDKLILDTMTDSGLWWRDDGQVCDGQIRKLYHAKNGGPGAIIRVRTLPESQAELFAAS